MLALFGDRVSENLLGCHLSVPKLGLGNSKKLLIILDKLSKINRTYGVVMLEMRRHLLVLKASFTSPGLYLFFLCGGWT